MEYTTLGRTGIETSRLGFGTMSLDLSSRQEALETLLYAYEKGVSYFDTTVIYGEGETEAVLGEALTEMRKRGKPPVISSRCKQKDADGLRRDIETSLRRLDLDSFDFYTNIWGIHIRDEWEECLRSGAVDALYKMKDEGLIKHLYCTTHAPGKDIRRMMNQVDFDLVVIGYNLINHPWRREGINVCTEKDCGIVCMNPLGSGMVPEWSSLFEEAAIRPEEQAVEMGWRFNLSEPRNHVTLGGFKNKAELEQALAAAEDPGAYYSREEREELFRKLEKAAKALPEETRRELGRQLNNKMYIWREEIAQLLDLFVLGIFH